MEVGPKLDAAENFIPIESLDNQQVRNYLFKVWTDKLPIQSFRKGSSHENEKIYSDNHSCAYDRLQLCRGDIRLRWWRSSAGYRFHSDRIPGHLTFGQRGAYP